MSYRMHSTSGDIPNVRPYNVRRVFWLPLALSAPLVVALLVGMLLLSWRSLERLEPIEKHLSHVARIQGVSSNIEQLLIKHLRGGQIDPPELLGLRAEIDTIARLEGAPRSEGANRLVAIAAHLEEAEDDPTAALLAALAEIRVTLDGLRHAPLLSQIQRDTRIEVALTALVLLVGPIFLAIALVAIQRRTRVPFRALEELLTRLAKRDYRPVPDAMLDGIDRIAHPAFRSYNELVARLRELEAEHCDRERTLEYEVRHATEALLAQSRELARAERLAAVGAVSAGLAHELRNPLAGIQMACIKLHRALEDTEHAGRLAAVNGELKRIGYLLTSQVDAARHLPEPLEQVAVERLVGELMTLLRYQIPAGIAIATQIPSDLRCLLPAAGLRQALLNLVLNAAQVLEGSGSISITAEPDGETLRVTVADSGPGFPEALLRAGIRPFATGREGGTGLGLAMVRRFVRDHDGELRLANQAPHGALVTLRLPCRSGGPAGGEQDG